MITRTSALSFRDQVRRRHIHTRTGSYLDHEPPDVGAATLTGELEHVLAGRRVDGTALPHAEAQRAVRRFQAVLGAKQPNLTPAQREDILAGNTAAGTAMTVAQYHERMDTSRCRIGYVDLTFSAPKSASVAWAFAPTEAERGMIHQAHRDAIGGVMQDVEAQIGRARKGKAGQDGVDQGSIGWVSFDHYTARPTCNVWRGSFFFRAH